VDAQRIDKLFVVRKSLIYFVSDCYGSCTPAAREISPTPAKITFLDHPFSKANNRHFLTNITHTALPSILGHINRDSAHPAIDSILPPNPFFDKIYPWHQQTILNIIPGTVSPKAKTS
jgi:hypothetical protein